VSSFGCLTKRVCMSSVRTCFMSELGQKNQNNISKGQARQDNSQTRKSHILDKKIHSGQGLLCCQVSPDQTQPLETRPTPSVSGSCAGLYLPAGYSGLRSLTWTLRTPSIPPSRSFIVIVSTLIISTYTPGFHFSFLPINSINLPSLSFCLEMRFWRPTLSLVFPS
jgi:hypothetical protein